MLAFFYASHYNRWVILVLSEDNYRIVAGGAGYLSGEDRIRQV